MKSKSNKIPKIERKILHVGKVFECEVVERVNRFVVNVKVGKKCHKAWINNTGRLQEFLVKGRKGFCMKKEKGKTAYRLFSIKDGKLGAVIDTQLQMRAFEKCLEMNFIPWLDGCKMIKRNAKLRECLIDYLLDCDGKKIYLEVKSAVLKEKKYAMYPDCPSARGRKHLKELMNYSKNGEAMILFIAALPGIKAFKPNKNADEKLYDLLLESHQRGVKIKAMNIYYNQFDSFIYLSNPDLRVNLQVK